MGLVPRTGSDFPGAREDDQKCSQRPFQEVPAGSVVFILSRGQLVGPWTGGWGCKVHSLDLGEWRSNKRPAFTSLYSILVGKVIICYS